jgi:hypothetical protein
VVWVWKFGPLILASFSQFPSFVDSTRLAPIAKKILAETWVALQSELIVSSPFDSQQIRTMSN